ncbi:MAG: sigma-70 family RNA polymerase sigma factor [Gammaproteobacteria bacterium]
MASASYTTDDALIEGLKAGNDAAYRQLIALHHNKMLQIARAIAGPAIADEIVQDAWIKVMQSLDGFEGRSSLRSWIIQITRNHAITRLRKESRQMSLEEMSDDPLHGRFDSTGHWKEKLYPWHEDTPEEVVSSDELARVISDTIDGLSTMQRTVLTLRDMEGLEMDAICHNLGISASNARVLLHRARNHVRDAIERHERAED